MLNTGRTTKTFITTMKIFQFGKKNLLEPK